MRTIALLVVTALLALTGCGSSTTAHPDAGGDASPLPGTGKVADYGFTATGLDGTRFEGASLEGSPTVLWFWAPWCPTCRAQSPHVSELAEAYDGKVEVIGVGGLDDAAAINDLAARIPHVTHVVDPDGEVWKHFGVTAQSSYTVIDRDGQILSERYLDDGEINELVARLAARSS